MRKETFKTQSSNVKLQEELKTTRTAVKILEESLEREKERSRAREQEAFEARYKIVGVQEQLEEALARIKVVEQERDAFKTAAKNEEVARIAAEGRIPLPRPLDPHDEFASPPKKGPKKRKVSGYHQEPRYSLSTMEIDSSVAAELEIEELNDRVQWEKQRADRALERVEFLEAECQMACGPHGRPRSRAHLGLSQRRGRESSPKEAGVSVPAVVEQPAAEEPSDESSQEPAEERAPVHKESPAPEDEAMQDISASPGFPERQPVPELAPPVSKKGPRRSTIFCPKEGIFRTVSEQEAEALEAHEQARVVSTDVAITEGQEPPSPIDTEFKQESEPELELEPEPEPEPEPELEQNLRMYARTPSVEPPAYALLGHQRTSLLSLLNAPHADAHQAPVPRIPMVPDATDAHGNDVDRRDQSEEKNEDYEFEPRESLEPRPHTSATLYTTVTTTVPIRDDRESSSSLSEKLRTPSNSSNASFDTTNPALTPTMTREQALAKIRERRGRARSAANGTATPHKKMVQGKDRRDMSAPTAKMAGGRARPIKTPQT